MLEVLTCLLAPLVGKRNWSVYEYWSKVLGTEPQDAISTVPSSTVTVIRTTDWRLTNDLFVPSKDGLSQNQVLS